MVKGFISLGRGVTLNVNVVKAINESKGKYYVNDIYGMTYTIDEKHYKRALKVLNK